MSTLTLEQELSVVDGFINLLCTSEQFSGPLCDRELNGLHAVWNDFYERVLGVIPRD